MFWSARENLGGLKHWRSLIGRIVLRRSRTALVDKLKAGGHEVEALRDIEGNLLCCRFCGYAVVSMPLTGGTIFTVCSSVGDNVVPNRERMARWAENIPKFAAGGSGAQLK